MESMLRSLQAEGQRRDQSILCEHRAGKLELRANNMMHADPRKGLVRVKREDSDGLVHLQWLERIKGVMGAPSRTNLEDDLIIFPGEAVMKRLNQGGEGSRIYVLKFQEGDRKLFFWFQEEDAGGDESFVKKVNISLNGEEPPEPEPESTQPQQANNNGRDDDGDGNKEGGDGDGGSGGKDDAAVPMDATTTAKEGVDGDGDGGKDAPSSGAGGGAAEAEAEADGAAATATDEGGYPELATHPLPEHTSPGAGVSEAALAAALLAAATSVDANQAAAMRQPAGPSLAQVLRPDTILPLLRNKEIQERLFEYLPEEHRHESAILELASSPQFHQQIETFSQALQSGQLNLNAFGIPHHALTVADFLKSIESISEQEKAKENGEN